MIVPGDYVKLSDVGMRDVSRQYRISCNLVLGKHRTGDRYLILGADFADSWCILDNAYFPRRELEDYFLCDEFWFHYERFGAVAMRFSRELIEAVPCVDIILSDKETIKKPILPELDRQFWHNGLKYIISEVSEDKTIVYTDLL